MTIDLGAPASLAGTCPICKGRHLPLWTVDGLDRCAHCCVVVCQQPGALVAVAFDHPRKEDTQ